MNRVTPVVFRAGIAVGVVWLAAASSLAGIQYNVLVGVDYAAANQKWAADATKVNAAITKADNKAVINEISGVGGVGVTKNGVLNAIAAAAAAAKAGDSFTFYYSGHGTYFGNPAAPDLVNPSLNPCTEALYINSDNMNPLNGMITETELTTAMAAFAPGVMKLSFLDACFAGGFWYGPGLNVNALTGSLVTVPMETLISAADENSTAPGSSAITNNWITDIGANGFNLTTMTKAQLNAMYGRINPGGVANGGNIKSPPGFPAPGPGDFYPYDPETFEPESQYSPGAQFWSNVPEPSTWVMATFALAAVLAVGRKKLKRAA